MASARGERRGPYRLDRSIRGLRSKGNSNAVTLPEGINSSEHRALHLSDTGHVAQEKVGSARTACSRLQHNPCCRRISPRFQLGIVPVDGTSYVPFSIVAPAGLHKFFRGSWANRHAKELALTRINRIYGDYTTFLNFRMHTSTILMWLQQPKNTRASPPLQFLLNGLTLPLLWQCLFRHCSNVRLRLRKMKAGNTSTLHADYSRRCTNALADSVSVVRANRRSSVHRVTAGPKAFTNNVQRRCHLLRRSARSRTTTIWTQFSQCAEDS